MRQSDEALLAPLHEIHAQLIAWEQGYQLNKPDPPIGLIEDIMSLLAMVSALTGIIEEHIRGHE